MLKALLMAVMLGVLGVSLVACHASGSVGENAPVRVAR